MRSANCNPISHPMLPPTHQHHMWDAWDMAAEICLSQLPQLVLDPSTEFQVCFVLYSFLQLYTTALVLLIKRVPILFLAKSVFY
jgi:hypothetical protein